MLARVVGLSVLVLEGDFVGTWLEIASFVTLCIAFIPLRNTSYIFDILMTVVAALVLVGDRLLEVWLTIRPCFAILVSYFDIGAVGWTSWAISQSCVPLSAWGRDGCLSLWPSCLGLIIACSLLIILRHWRPWSVSERLVLLWLLVLRAVYILVAHCELLMMLIILSASLFLHSLTEGFVIVVGFFVTARPLLVLSVWAVRSLRLGKTILGLMRFFISLDALLLVANLVISVVSRWFRPTILKTPGEIIVFADKLLYFGFNQTVLVIKHSNMIFKSFCLRK